MTSYQHRREKPRNYVTRANLGDFWPEGAAVRAPTVAPESDITIYLEPAQSKIQRRRALLWLRDPYCVWCGFLYLDPDHATIEHLVPVAYGGGNSIANTRLACGRCNHSRGKWYAKAMLTLKRRRALQLQRRGG